MLKKGLNLIVCLLLLQSAKAASTDSLTYYFKNSGKEVKQKDSADYYRVILPPDTNVDKELYRVFEFYPNGKLKTVATSLTQPVSLFLNENNKPKTVASGQSVDLVLDGTCVEFFKNGVRKRTANYKNGRRSGAETNYYPNGKLYNILNIEDENNGYYSRYYTGYFPDPRYGYKVQVTELRDSTGKLLVSNGTGHVIVLDEEFKKIVEEGDLKNNKKEGEWRGMIADSGKFICTFHKDGLKSGISYMKSGHHYSFKNIYENAVFSDGPDAFYYFIRKNLQYPESAKKHKAQGVVLVGFDVEVNGTVSNVQIVSGVIKSLDDEAVRVISLSPLWYPATRFGIPFRVHRTVSVSFYNM